MPSINALTITVSSSDKCFSELGIRRDHLLTVRANLGRFIKKRRSLEFIISYIYKFKVF